MTSDLCTWGGHRNKKAFPAWAHKKNFFNKWFSKNFVVQKCKNKYGPLWTGVEQRVYSKRVQSPQNASEVSVNFFHVISWLADVQFKAFTKSSGHSPQPLMCFCSSSTWRATSTWRWTSVSLLCWRRTPCGSRWTGRGTKAPGSSSSPSGSCAPTATT